LIPKIKQSPYKAFPYGFDCPNNYFLSFSNEIDNSLPHMIYGPNEPFPNPNEAVFDAKNNSLDGFDYTFS
jgi:hypothetical protein